MANTLGTLSSAVIIQRALELVFKKRPILRDLCTDLSNEAVDYGQAVKSRLLAVPTVNDFGTGATDRADTDVSVTINNFKEIQHSFTATELSSTHRDLVDESAEPMAVALGNHMVDAIGALWVAGTYTNTAITETIANHDYETLVGARKALNTAGVPMDPRIYVANSDAYAKLLNDSRCVDADKNPGADAITTGYLKGVAGFNAIYEYPDMITTGNLCGFAMHPNAAVIATRVPKNPEEVLGNAKFPGNLGIVTEPATGLSVMVNEWVGTDLSANVRLVWMYGVSAGTVAAGQIIKTA
jgi:hypothetical protein